MKILSIDLDSEYFDNLKDVEGKSVFDRFMAMDKAQIMEFLKADPENHNIKTLDEHLSDLNNQLVNVDNAYFRTVDLD